MKNLRFYGNRPYSIAVLHGGPGYPGAMAPVARELAPDWGVLEPLQTTETIDGQVAELADVLRENASLSAILVGWLWGSTLALLTAARHPGLVHKLILVSGAPLEMKYRIKSFDDTMSRLSDEERKEVFYLEDIVYGNAVGDKSASMARIFALFSKTDSFELLPFRDEVLEYQADINMKVGAEAQELYAGDELPKLIKKIRCSVAAIHGDSDTHPPEGVQEPLSRALKDFHLIMLEKCGHMPWYEKYARDKFYEILKKEIESGFSRD